MKGTTLDVTVSEERGTVLLHCVGELDLSSVPRFSEAAQAVRGRSIVLDCVHLRFVDSSGIRALLDTTRRWTKDGVTWRITGSPELRRVADLLGVVDALRIENGKPR